MSTAKTSGGRGGAARRAAPSGGGRSAATRRGGRRPAGPVPGALLLAPGAGADRTHHTLAALARAARPLATSRLDFPYRKAGRRAPDPAEVAVAHVRREAGKLVRRAGIDPAQLVLGGRSYGGRMCSLAVADGLPAAGLVLLSYPLHPPGKPDKLRVDHFAALDLPVLFVAGDKDPFGSPEEVAEHVAAIPGPVTQVWLRGGHDPRGQDDAIVAAVLTWLAALGAPVSVPAR